MTVIKEPYYETIKKLAENAGLSITQLAKNASVSPRMLWHYKDKDPKPWENLRKLQAAAAEEKKRRKRLKFGLKKRRKGK